MRALLPHQVKALNFAAVKKDRVGIFMAPGTGKTFVAITWLIDKTPALICCRRDDFMTWQAEFEQAGIDPSDVTYVKDNSKAFRQTKFTVITHDSVKSAPLTRRLAKTFFKAIVLDEAHCVKRAKSRRTKAMVKVTANIPKRMALTGSPITNNSIEDAFGIALFIDQGKTFGENFYKFRASYFSQAGPKWVPRAGSYQRVMTKLNTIAFSVHEDAVLALPPVRRYIIESPMSPIQARYYKQITEEWELDDGNGGVEELMQAIVILSKLRQVASGFLYRREPPIAEGIPGKRLPTLLMPCPKIDTLRTLVGKGGRLEEEAKIVIWCSHTAEIRRLGNIFSSAAVTYFGSDRDEKGAARLRFQRDPSCRYFIAQVDAGVGMNELICARTAIYFSNSHRVVSRLQSERRNRRKGSEGHETIDYYDLVTKGSVDVSILKTLLKKVDISNKMTFKRETFTFESIKKLIFFAR